MADRRFTVVVERCGVVTLCEEQPPGPVRDGQFDVETIFSGLSTGTDLSWVKGTNPALQSWACSWQANPTRAIQSTNSGTCRSAGSLTALHRPWHRVTWWP